MHTSRALKLASDILDSVLPPRCVVTGEIVERQGMISPEAWTGLDFAIDPLCACCGFPFEFDVDDGTRCTSCIEHPPPFETSRSALKYNETSRTMVLGFKHADKTHIVRSFVPWLSRSGKEMLAEADYLIPVPLHYWRLVSRRYNQAALIAEALSDAQHIPTLLDGLIRKRATPSQGHLNAKARHKNVKKAFAVNDKHKAGIQGKTIILIDDVYTTGATIKECTKTLMKAGAGKVHALTLARVVREDF